MNKPAGFLLITAAMVAGTLLAGCSKPAAPTAPTEAAAAATAATAASGNVADIDVSEHVKTALLQNESLKGFDISVVTVKGDVRLIGVLNNQAQVDEALKTARAAEGAHAIHDELTIKP